MDLSKYEQWELKVFDFVQGVATHPVVTKGEAAAVMCASNLHMILEGFMRKHRPDRMTPEQSITEVHDLPLIVAEDFNDDEWAVVDRDTIMRAWSNGDIRYRSFAAPRAEDEEDKEEDAS